MKYRVATSYCETGFKQYDGQFAELIAELKAAEGVRRTAINKVIFEMIRKQEEIKYTVAESDAPGALKAGPVKDERFKELKAKEEKVTKDFQKHLDNGMAQFDAFQADKDAGYPGTSLGSPLESKLLDCYMLGTFKGGSSFALGLVMRTVDDHIHVFNVPKGMEQKTPEEVFDSYIPGAHVVKFPDAKPKKVGTKIVKAPEKGDAAKKVKATAALVKPTHTVFLNLSECFKVNNANGDVTIMEKTKPKKGKKVKVTKFMLRSIPADNTWATIPDESMMKMLNHVYENEQEYKDANAAPPKA